MKTLFSRIGKFIKWMLLALVAGSILLVLLFRYMPVYTSPLMFIRAFEQVSRGEQIRWHHSWVDLDSISPDLPLAVMSCDDQNFLKGCAYPGNVVQNAHVTALCGGGVPLMAGFWKYRNILEMNNLTVQRFKNTYKDCMNAKKYNEYVRTHF